METRVVTFNLRAFISNYILADSLKDADWKEYLEGKFTRFYKSSSESVKTCTMKYLDGSEVVKEHKKLRSFLDQVDDKISI